MTLENLNLAQLVVLHNAVAEKPVKKFSSKADAIKRLQALEAKAEDIDVWQARFDGAYAELMASIERVVVEEPSDEGKPLSAADEYTAEEMAELGVPNFESVQGEINAVEDAAVEEPADAVQVEETSTDEPTEPAEGDEPTGEAAEEGETVESPAAGFQYLTRDELKALAETDPEARQAYRMARRKAARAARKAKAK